MKREYRKFNGKTYRHRAAFPLKVARGVAKELKERGLLVRIVKNGKVLGSTWYDVYYHIKGIHK